MNWLISWAILRGWRKGIVEGRRSWQVVGAVGLAARAMQRLAGRKEKVVYSEPLEVGSALLISNLREERSGKRAD